MDLSCGIQPLYGITILHIWGIDYGCLIYEGYNNVLVDDQPCAFGVLGQEAKKIIINFLKTYNQMIIMCVVRMMKVLKCLVVFINKIKLKVWGILFLSYLLDKSIDTCPFSLLQAFKSFTISVDSSWSDDSFDK